MKPKIKKRKAGLVIGIITIHGNFDDPIDGFEAYKMNLLVDTHVLLWFLINDALLTANTKNIIESTQNLCFISIATFWEIANKYSLKRLELKSDLINFFELIERSGFEILPITVKQILELSTLDFHHHDLFNRILISQAKAEKFDIITKGAMFSKYNIHYVRD